jgi:hypothetical protein
MRLGEIEERKRATWNAERYTSARRPTKPGSCGRVAVVARLPHVVTYINCMEGQLEDVNPGAALGQDRDARSWNPGP